MLEKKKPSGSLLYSLILASNAEIQNVNVVSMHSDRQPNELDWFFCAMDNYTRERSPGYSAKLTQTSLDLY